MPDEIDTAEIRRLRAKSTVDKWLENIDFYSVEDGKFIGYLVDNATVIADELDRLRAEIDRLNHEDNFDFFHVSEKRIKELERQITDADKRITELEAENAELTARLNEADWSEVGD